MNNTPRRFVITSTQQRVDILDSIAEIKHQDRSSVVNESILEWILKNLDDPDEHADQIKEIFST